MSKYITVVLEFEDIEQMPEVSVRTQALGGSVVAFSQGDCLSVLENIHAALEGQHVEHVVINDEEWVARSVYQELLQRVRDNKRALDSWMKEGDVPRNVLKNLSDNLAHANVTIVSARAHEEESMRTAIVNSKDLGNDWRAEAHCEPTEEDFAAAKKEGWTAGARGTENPTSIYATHGNQKVRQMFIASYHAGSDARKRFLGQ